MCTLPPQMEQNSTKIGSCQAEICLKAECPNLFLLHVLKAPSDGQKVSFSATAGKGQCRYEGETHNKWKCEKDALGTEWTMAHTQKISSTYICFFKRMDYVV